MAESPIPPLPVPIFLVGFMASGKSTVGRALAAHLHTAFLDLDEEIVKRAGKTIGEIVQQEGEPYFRQLETACLQQAVQEQVGVIALGGGAFTQAVNRSLVAQQGISVWLDVPFAVCWERIQQDAVVRPLAATEEAARVRFQQRIALYEQAQLRISVTAKAAPEAIATQILATLRSP